MREGGRPGRRQRSAGDGQSAGRRDQELSCQLGGRGHRPRPLQGPQAQPARLVTSVVGPGEGTGVCSEYSGSWALRRLVFESLQVQEL